MMGVHQSQNQLFSYRVNLEHRVRRDHPLRRIAATVDFTFVRAEVAHCYGHNGNVGIDPTVLLKLMFLLFYDDIASERELMERLPERLDYLWFLGYGLEDAVPDHSVLSKARRRWGQEVFAKVFIHTVQQCVQAGLVDGKKIHVDSSLIDANASRQSVVKSSPELIAAYKTAYAAQESKLQDCSTHPGYQAINDQMVSPTDPDAALARKGGGLSRPRYHHHRAVDDAHGVITAVETTPGSIVESSQLMNLVQQHQTHTGATVATAVADSAYGTAENLAACVEAGIAPHLGQGQKMGRRPEGAAHLFGEDQFIYDKTSDTYRCPAGQKLARRLHSYRGSWEYKADKGVCQNCALRAQCTNAKLGRTVQRHSKETLVQQGRQMAASGAARRDRQRRQHLMEGSFAQAANEHGFKRSRWRRLWRQQIQDWLIAAVQNVKILLKAVQKRNQGAMAQRAAAENGLCGGEKSFLNLWRLGDPWGVANNIICNTPTL
jgi:transposase